MYGKLRNDVGEVILTLCKYKDVQIIDGAICENHIYLSVTILIKLSISSFIEYLKGKNTLMIHVWHSELQRMCFAKSVFGRANSKCPICRAAIAYISKKAVN